MSQINFNAKFTCAECGQDSKVAYDDLAYNRTSGEPVCWSCADKQIEEVEKAGALISEV